MSTYEMRMVVSRQASSVCNKDDWPWTRKDDM